MPPFLITKNLSKQLTYINIYVQLYLEIHVNTHGQFGNCANSVFQIRRRNMSKLPSLSFTEDLCLSYHRQMLDILMGADHLWTITKLHCPVTKKPNDIELCFGDVQAKTTDELATLSSITLISERREKSWGFAQNAELYFIGQSPDGLPNKILYRRSLIESAYVYMFTADSTGEKIYRKHHDRFGQSEMTHEEAVEHGLTGPAS